MTIQLSCRGIVCQLGGQTVIDGLDFEVGAGQAIALAGSSGSGKSTLLRIMAGLQIPDQGEVWIDGKRASVDGQQLVPPHLRGIGMMFQDLALWPNLSVAKNVGLGLSGLRLGRIESAKRIDESLGLCGVSELANRRPGTLSGGQQQRVALARALATRPKLLLLDEPMGGLDLITKQSVLEQIVRLRIEPGFGIVLVTHDLAEVTTLCDSIAILEQGKIAECFKTGDSDVKPTSALGMAMADQWNR